MSISFSWERRIERAQQLSEEASHAILILAFYVEILKWQQSIFDYFSDTDKRSLTGEFERDSGIILEHFGSLLNLVRQNGSEELSAQAGRLNSTRDRWKEYLAAWWNGEYDPAQSFFARVCLQPYLEFLAQINNPPLDSHINSRAESEQPDHLCPFCGRKPQLAILTDDPSISTQVVEGMESGRRILMCGDCQTAWSFPRIACPNCLEVDPHKLAYYVAEEFPTLRVDCCDTCRHYLKTIDMMKDRRLVPLIDELAAIPLDLWAIEQGYTKIEPNLAGI